MSRTYINPHRPCGGGSTAYALLLLLGSALLLALGIPCQAADDAADKDAWGNFTATIRFDGDPPERKALVVEKDRGVFKDPILDPSLIVDPKTKGIANVVMWLYLAPQQKAPRIHASYKEQAGKEVVSETRGGMIEPHVVLLWTAQKLVIKNRDPVGHVRVASLSNSVSLGSQLIPYDADYSPRLTKPERMPVQMGCSIHPWEIGYLVIRDNPYMAVSNLEGQLVIKNLPVGKHTFVLWHEEFGFIKTAKRKDDKVEEFPKGRLTVEIKPGDNDLGEFIIKPQEK